MNVALWILKCLLAFGFLAAGTMKVARSKEQVSKMLAWAKEFEPAQIKLIGTAEILGAVHTHLRLKEGPMAIPAAVLALLSAAIAAGRFFVLPL